MYIVYHCLYIRYYMNLKLSRDLTMKRNNKNIVSNPGDVVKSRDVFVFLFSFIKMNI